MLWRRRTLIPMDEELERLLASVADVVLEQGGDWEATFAVLRRMYPGTELVVPDNDPLAQATVLAVMLLNEYEEPGLGPKVVAARRDRRRRLLLTPPRRNGWGWRATG